MKLPNILAVTLFILLFSVPSIGDDLIHQNKWPSWYEEKVTNILSVETGETLLIAIKSLPPAQLPENVIRVLVERLLRNDLEKKTRSSIETALAYSDNNLDFIFRKILTIALKDANSELWDILGSKIINNLISPPEFLPYKQEISTFIKKTGINTQVFFFSRDTFEEPLISEVPNITNFTLHDTYKEFAKSNYQSTSLAQHLGNLLNEPSEIKDNYLQKLTSVLSDPKFANTTKIDVTFESAFKSNPNSIRFIIDLLKIESHSETLYEAIYILRNNLSSNQFQQEVMKFRQQLLNLGYLDSDLFSYLDQNWTVREINILFSILKQAIEVKDIATRNTALQIIANLNSLDKSHLEILKRDNKFDILFLDALQSFGEQALPTLHLILNSKTTLDKEIYYKALGLYVQIAQTVPKLQLQVNSLLKKITTEPIEEEELKVFIKKGLLGEKSKDNDFNWIDKSLIMKAIESPSLKNNWFVLKFSKLIARKFTSSDLRKIVASGANSIYQPNHAAADEILKNADHSQLSKLFPFLLKNLSALDRTDSVMHQGAAFDRERYEAKSQNQWATKLLLSESLRPLLIKQIPSLIQQLDQAETVTTQCSIMELIVHLGSDGQSAIPSVFSLVNLVPTLAQQVTEEFYTPMPSLYHLAYNKDLPKKFSSDLITILSMNESTPRAIEKKIFAIRTLQLLGIKEEDDASALTPLLANNDNELRYEATKLLVMHKKSLKVEHLKMMLPRIFEFNRGYAAIKSYKPSFLEKVKEEENYLDLSCSGMTNDNHFFNSSWILNSGPMSIELALTFLEYSWSNENYLPQARYLYLILSPDTQVSSAMLSLFDQRGNAPINLLDDSDAMQKYLQTLTEVWPATEKHTQIRQLLVSVLTSIAVTNEENWTSADREKLKTIGELVKKIDTASGKSILKVARSKTYKLVTKGVKIFLLCHFLFWLAFLFFYPKYPWIRAQLFWDKRIRKYFGLFYIELMLTSVHWFRQRLLKPFEKDMAENAELSKFNHKSYFSNTPIFLCEQAKTIELDELKIKQGKQYLFTGISGLGKSMYMRYMFYCHHNDSRSTHVFLKASECNVEIGNDNVIVEAIRERIGALPVDSGFLKKLIYTGAFTIYIDGINEASTEVRVEIKKFLKIFKTSTVLLTTQPIDWRPPEDTICINMLPLDSGQRLDFLDLYFDNNSSSQKLSHDQYIENCMEFVKTSHEQASRLPSKHRSVVEGILSNPMDLNICSKLISDGEKPNILALQRQQYELMAADYRSRSPNQDNFPLELFAEAAFEITQHQHNLPLSAELLKINPKRFDESINCLARHRLIIPTNVDNLWRFRHDKVRDFFVVQTFLGDNNSRPLEYIDDPRFCGVYFLLAFLLPSDVAEVLRNSLIDYAFTNSDYAVSKSFVDGLRLKGIENHGLDEAN